MSNSCIILQRSGSLIYVRPPTKVNQMTRQNANWRTRMTRQQQSIFQRHPVVTITSTLVVFLFLFLAVAEILLKQFHGLGNPVLFYKHPSFGYRLQPNQETYRLHGSHFRVNNLGLRANEDWNSTTDDKILFLGDSVTYGGNRISNEDLFSAVAVRDLAHWRSGNGGITNWGVENVHGLIVGEQFLTARVYVTTFIENDFYRGLTSGNNKPWIRYELPRFALQELASFLWYKYVRNPREINQAELERVPRAVRAETAARKLKEMDEFLTSKGYRHVIFISPTRKQIVSGDPKDDMVESLLRKYNIGAIYLMDELTLLPTSTEQKDGWYQDNVHLTVRGHLVWGRLICSHLEKLGYL